MGKDVPERVQLDLAQFKALDGKLGGIDGAINKLAEGIAPVDEGETLSENVGKWLGQINATIEAGFKSIVEAIAARNKESADLDQLDEQIKKADKEL